MVSLQKSGLAGQLLKIKVQYECLVKLIEKMEIVKYTIKEAVQAIQELDFGEDACNINQYIKQIRSCISRISISPILISK